MIIAQISDCHVAASGRGAYGNVEPKKLLREAIEAIKAMPRPPDWLLVTGDLTENGRAEEYAIFHQIVSELKVPLIHVVGNHDDRETLCAAFHLRSKFRVQAEYVQYAVDCGSSRILVLDTTTPQSGEPSLCAKRLAWIDSELSRDKRPVLLAMHHPPFPVGVAWMNPKTADWARQLADLVRAHPSVVRVVCGHVHRLMTVSWAGTIVMAAPSTAHQVFLDLNQTGGPPLFSSEAPGFLVHAWLDTEIISYGVAIPGFTDVIS